jgi:hypothetical protein
LRAADGLSSFFNLIKKISRFLSGGLEFFVSAEVQTPAECHEVTIRL